MNQEKIVAIITGAISILLAVAYLIIVQLLDLRGKMIPAPTLEGIITLRMVLGGFI
ncbi:hypothetical protein [Aphanothece sacrum]|uniref:Glucose-inhibited division protein A n=1 Tax=Aphanothece sacrum FPU1 TaxID=1920663 RepID=A0A401IMP3_APHSA|nr:hypothetical protein [Aphanothece sacrum]GBF82512.1 hypothetical protein AsFPU1_3942 [Aphanothece sacrum FPU1]GBF85754.1 hypothetical protein AsFPU3_2819 [Aphanothece sacrum FPU3]